MMVLGRKLDTDLKKMIYGMEGGGFGDEEAREQHKIKIEYLKFRINQRNTIFIGISAAFIGAFVSAILSILLNN